MSVAVDYDLAIVGGGLVGATLACALSQLPLRIALLDAKSSQATDDAHFDVRAVALTASTQRILHTLGLWPALVAQSTPIQKIHVSEQGQFGFTRLHAQDYSLPALGYVIAIPDLLHALHVFIKQQKNISVFSSTQVKDFSDTTNYISLILNNQSNALTTRLCIIADGGKLPMREKLNMTPQTHDYEQVALASTIGLARDHKNIAYERFTPQGPLALLPLSQQRCSLVWSLPRGVEQDILHLPNELFLQHLQQHFGYRLGRFVRVGQRDIFPLYMSQAHVDATQPVILMGNAAHTLHPVAGQGFNLSVRDIAAFTELLAKDCSEPHTWATPAWRQTYYQTRKREQRRVMAMVDLLARNFTPRWLPVRFLRNSALVALDFLPPLKQAFAKRSMGYFPPVSALACGVQTTTN